MSCILRVHKRMSLQTRHKGWTIVLMDRATRFLWEMHCGRKERKLFKHAMALLGKVIQQTSDLTLLTDGERRYGSLLFEISEVLRAGKRGRPRKTLRKGVKVRLKNKGSQRHNAVANDPSIKPHIEASRHRTAYSHHRYSCQSSGSLQYIATSTLCCLSQTHQYLCKNPGTTAREIGCLLDCA